MRDGGAVDVLPAGTLVITTAFGPITASSPMLIGPSSTAPTPTSPGRRAGAPRRRTPVRAPPSADGHPLADQAVVADHRAPGDHDAVLVHDAEAGGRSGRWVQLDPVEVAHEEAEETRGPAAAAPAGPGSPAVAPDPEAIGEDRLEAGREEGPLRERGWRRSPRARGPQRREGRDARPLRTAGRECGSPAAGSRSGSASEVSRRTALPAAWRLRAAPAGPGETCPRLLGRAPRREGMWRSRYDVLRLIQSELRRCQLESSRRFFRLILSRGWGPGSTQTRREAARIRRSARAASAGERARPSRGTPPPPPRRLERAAHLRHDRLRAAPVGAAEGRRRCAMSYSSSAGSVPRT